MEIAGEDRVEIGQQDAELHPAFRHMVKQVGPCHQPQFLGLVRMQGGPGIKDAERHEEFFLGAKRKALKRREHLGRGDQRLQLGQRPVLIRLRLRRVRIRPSRP